MLEKTVQSLEICGKWKMSAMGDNEFHVHDAAIAKLPEPYVLLFERGTAKSTRLSGFTTGINILSRYDGAL